MAQKKDAARVGDSTDHPGTLGGPGVTSVLIGGKPAAVMGGLHTCARPTNPPHGSTIIAAGSASVLIGGQPAARFGDTALCGARIVSGESSVQIGG